FALTVFLQGLNFCDETKITSAATVPLAGRPSAPRRAMQRGAGRPWPDGDPGARVERARGRRVPSLRGQRGDALGTDSHHRATVANGQATADKLGGGLTGTGRCGGGELVGLPAQRRTSSAVVSSSGSPVWYSYPSTRSGMASSGRSAASTMTSRTAWSRVGRLRA